MDDFTHTRDEGVSARCCDAIRVEQKGLKLKGREILYTRFARSGVLFLIKIPNDASTDLGNENREGMRVEGGGQMSAKNERTLVARFRVVSD